jgi:CrcB protein
MVKSEGMVRYLYVVAGGGAGSLTRYLLGRAILQRFPNAQFALGTFSINVTGSFLIGLLMTLLLERWKMSMPYLQPLLVIGFLGGYTTFSSFEYDAYLSTRAGHFITALLYLTGSVVAGFGAVCLGAWLAAKK